MSTEYLSAEQLAQLLGVSQKAIQNWIQQRRLPGAVKCGRLWRFQRVAVEKRLLNGKLLLDKEV